jgi:hypothetical protein
LAIKIFVCLFICKSFLFIHNYLTLRKWCYTPLQHDFALDPMISPFVFHFSNICHVTTRKLRLHQRQRASERACVTFPLFVFGQGTTFFFLMVICNLLNLLLKSLPINIINCIKYQSVFYSFITILPSESGVTLHYSTILP